MPWPMVPSPCTVGVQVRESTQMSLTPAEPASDSTTNAATSCSGKSSPSTSFISRVCPWRIDRIARSGGASPIPWPPVGISRTKMIAVGLGPG